MTNPNSHVGKKKKKKKKNPNNHVSKKQMKKVYERQIPFYFFLNMKFYEILNVRQEFIKEWN